MSNSLFRRLIAALGAAVLLMGIGPYYLGDALTLGSITATSTSIALASTGGTVQIGNPGTQTAGVGVKAVSGDTANARFEGTGGVIVPTLQFKHSTDSNDSVLEVAESIGFRFTQGGAVMGAWKTGSGLEIGATGTGIADSYANSATIDFGSITNTCQDSSNVTVTGAAVGDGCVLGQPASPPAGAEFTCRFTAADTGVVRHCQFGTGDPSSGSYTLRSVDP